MLMPHAPLPLPATPSQRCSRAWGQGESFITFMRKEYPHVAKEQFADFGTVLTKKENIEDDIMEALSY